MRWIIYFKQFFIQNKKKKLMKLKNKKIYNIKSYFDLEYKLFFKNPISFDRIFQEISENKVYI